MLNAQAALDHPQVEALGLFQSLDYPGLPAPAPVGRIPITMSRTEGGVHMRAPLLGEHTDRILQSLGYNAESIAGLRSRGIV